MSLGWEGVCGPGEDLSWSFWDCSTLVILSVSWQSLSLYYIAQRCHSGLVGGERAFILMFTVKTLVGVCEASHWSTWKLLLELADESDHDRHHILLMIFDQPERCHEFGSNFSGQVVFLSSIALCSADTTFFNIHFSAFLLSVMWAKVGVEIFQAVYKYVSRRVDYPLHFRGRIELQSNNSSFYYLRYALL